MKKLWLALIFTLAAAAGFSFEFSPFVRRIIDASPQQLIDTLETTGSGTFTQELIHLVNSLSYRNPYFYSYDRLDAHAVRQLGDYFSRTSAAGEDVRWIWDKIWNVLMVGSGLIYDQNVAAYEADLGRLYELAYRPIDLRRSRYENDLIGFARLLLQPTPGRRARLSLPQVSPVPAQPVYTPAPVKPPYVPAPVQPAYAPVPAPLPSTPVFPVIVPARIIPRMPDPSSGQIYRIQVGSYLGMEMALEAVTRLRQAGFYPAYEINGEYYRVVIPGIPASNLPAAALLLGSAGFKEAWIREEW
jgi:hypothetical protein